MRARAPVRLVAALVALALGPTAWAHGPAPAAIATLAADDEGELSLVQLSVGAGVRQSDGRWYFACPALWGAPESPLMTATADTLWVAGDSGLTALDLPSGGATEVSVPVDSASVVAMRAWGGEAFVLGFAAGSASLWSLGGGGEAALTLEDEVRWSTLAVGPDVAVLGRAAGDELVVRSLSWAGEVRDERSYAFAGLVAPSLRFAGGRTYVVGAEAEGSALLAVEGESLRPLAAGEGAVHGPVRLASGALVAVVEGALVLLDAGGDGADGGAGLGTGEVLDDARRYTCLAEVSGAAYACAQESVWRLGATGRPESVAFDVADLVAELAPPTSAGPAALAQCGAEWADLAGHAGIPRRQPDALDASEGGGPADAGFTEAGDISTTSGGEDGCAVAGRGREPDPSWLLTAALVLSRRRRPGRRSRRCRRRRSRIPGRPAT